MYHLMRRTHLFTALVLFIFILLYAVSGYLLEFPLSPFLSSGPTVTRTEAFQYAGDKALPVLADYVKQTYDLHGILKTSQFDKKSGTYHFVFAGVKGYYDARVSKDTAHITLAIQPYKLGMVLIRMHHVAGFDGGPIYRAWGVMLDLVSIAVILFALSGVYLWYKLAKRHTLGWIVLATSIAYTAGTAVWCFYAK